MPGLLGLREEGLGAGLLGPRGRGALSRGLSLWVAVGERELSLSPTDARAEVQVSVPPLVEVMRGESVALLSMYSRRCLSHLSMPLTHM